MNQSKSEIPKDSAAASYHHTPRPLSAVLGMHDRRGVDLSARAHRIG